MSSSTTSVIAPRMLLALLSCVAAATSFAQEPPGDAPAYPVTVVDDLGFEVTLDAMPLRIVTMAPSHTETVCALMACERLVGVDLHSNWPPEVADRATLGTAFEPNLEAVIALAPDLVLVDEYSSLQQALTPLGIPVYAGTPQTLAETLAFVALLGDLLGTPEAAAVLVEELEDAVVAVSETVAGAARPQVFLEIDATPYGAGRGSYLDELLTIAGGDNVLPSDLGPFPQVDPEYLVASDPEVIVLLDGPFGVSAAAVAARPGWAGIAAVANGRVFELAPHEVDMLSRAGPRLGEAIELLARLLHPGLWR